MRKLSFSNPLVIISILFCVATAITASGQTLTTLVNFNGTDGSRPTSGSPLVQATDGNLYGITYYGGTPTSCSNSPGTGCGTFFKMSPSGQLTSLYSFCSQPQCSDGSDPVSLIQGTDGNFYGVTFYGGVSTSYCTGCGTVFKITPSGLLTTLYSFCAQAGCPDGSEPTGLIEATNGILYGVTFAGGASAGGTIFQITPAGKFSTLYSFCAVTGCPDGSSPNTNLMQASNKNLYGATQFGGAHNGGTLFEITPAGKLTTVHSFVHGQANTMIQGADRNIYGTTTAGGTGSHGTVFKLSFQGSLSVIHDFCPLNCATGDSPLAGLALGNDGNFYGTTYLAGITYYAGSVFELSPTGTFNTLYLFCSQTGCSDGWGAGALMQATSGTFYGTTAGGGSSNDGTVYSLSTGLGPFVATRPTFGSVGELVTILGNSLTGATSVTFNGTPAKFKVISDTYIQTQVPPAATPGTIEVTTPSGTLSSNVPFQATP